MSLSLRILGSPQMIPLLFSQALFKDSAGKPFYRIIGPKLAIFWNNDQFLKKGPAIFLDGPQFT